MVQEFILEMMRTLTEAIVLLACLALFTLWLIV